MNHSDRPTDLALNEAHEEAEAARLIAEGLSDRTPVATYYKDMTTAPLTGDAPPVPQAGRAPMSQKATDVSAIMLAAGAASVPIGGMTSLVLYTLGTVDPVNLALGVGGPIALILAVGGLLRRAHGIRTINHHHYEGPVHQDHSTHSTKNNGLIAQTKNDNRRR
ncbi:hypothetical protein [Streptomyces sp. SYSU K217416]